MTVRVYYADADRPRVPRALRSAARGQMGGHTGPVQITREHEQWFIGCNGCGFLASWDEAGSVEQMELGDESCPATGGGGSDAD